MTKEKELLEKEQEDAESFLIDRGIPDRSFSDLGGMKDVKEKMWLIIKFLPLLIKPPYNFIFHFNL